MKRSGRSQRTGKRRRRRRRNRAEDRRRRSPVQEKATSSGLKHKRVEQQKEPTKWSR